MYLKKIWSSIRKTCIYPILSDPDQFGFAALQLYHIYLHSQKRYLAIFLLILEGFVNVEYKSLQSIVQ